MKTVKILGITNDNTTCDLCGKTHLKKTVVLEINGAIVYYGSTCAAKTITGSKRDSKTINHQAMAIQKANDWLNNGYDSKTVANGIWNKFGYTTQIKNGVLEIASFGKIKL